MNCPFLDRQALRFAGYAALFGVRDAGGDVIAPGAFAAGLVALPGPPPLLWEHRPHHRVGVVERVAEDARGLRVVARLDPGTRAAALLRAGAISGLSFGYRARDYRIDGATRVLSRVDLFEVSLVAHPLQAGARVHLVLPGS